MLDLGFNAAALAGFGADQAIALMVRSVRDRFDLALPVMRASSSSEPGAFSAMTRNSSRLPADRTLAKDSVEVNQTLGSGVNPSWKRRGGGGPPALNLGRHAPPGAT